jgi:hypothetical protein
MPWLIARIEGRPSILRTRLDAWMVLFLATVALGYLASWNRPAANSQLWLILLGVLVFYNIANQTLPRIWNVFDLGGLLGTMLALLFVASSLVRFAQSYLSGYTFLGSFFQIFRRLPQLLPNIAGGLIALLLPLAIAGLIAALRSRDQIKSVTRGCMVSVMAIGLLATSSRGAWFALILGCIASGIGGYHEARRGHLRSGWIAIVVICLIAVLGGWIGSNVSDQLPVLIDTIVPGAASAQSRVELAQNSIALLADTPFTGSGLGSFSGLYSRYILVISNFFYGYAHNLFIDIALSQSPFGLLAFMAILIVGIESVVRPAQSSQPGWEETILIRAALLASSLIILVHGLIDDPLYSGRGVILLFFIPGLGTAIHSHLRPEHAGANPQTQTRNPEKQVSLSVPLVWLSCALLLGTGLLGLSKWRTLSSVVYSNLAALIQARSDMAQSIVFDINVFPTDSYVEDLLSRSLDLDPNNRTAHHRMGLLAMRHGQFRRAAGHLEAAARLDPVHPGIEKSLGYAYTWLGEVDKASLIFAPYPEAAYELGLYANWWLTQDREDLAANAAEVEMILSAQGNE